MLKLIKFIVLFCCFGLLVVGSLNSKTGQADAGTPVDGQEPVGVGNGYILHFTPILTGIIEPVGITHAGDDRLFVWGRKGIIHVLDENQNLLPTPFLDISDRIDTAFWEQGLLGLAFHPNYAQNRYFYVNYTNLNGNTVVARYQTSIADPNIADPASEFELLQVSQPFDAHNGGDMHFGPDGYLYIGLGDGGGTAGLPFPQDGQSLLGKMLRLDVDGGAPYAIPPDNPFVGNPDFRDEIYLLGLRNPWRFSIDRLTGDLFIGNVGGLWYEEVEYKAAGDPAGGNYGWPCYEGIIITPYFQDFCDPNSDFIAPITGYDNPEEGCAIIGGYVYRGNAYPEMIGDYLFGDLCTGQVWRAYYDDEEWVRQKLQALGQTISSFGEDDDGELYITSINAGIVYRLEAVNIPHFLPQMMQP